MSVAAAERSLFASKGRAAPVGIEADEPTAPAAMSTAPCPGEGNTPDAVAGHGVGHGETHAGSLLTFRLRSEPGKSALSEELKAALACESSETAELSKTTDSAEPLSSHAAAIPGRIEAPRPARSAPATATVESEPPATRLDRPLFPQARRERNAELATRPAAMTHEIPRSSAWRTALPIGAAVMAIAAVGWLVSRSNDGPAGEPAAAADMSSPVAAAEMKVEAGVALPPAEPAARTTPGLVADEGAPLETDSAAGGAAMPAAPAPSTMDASGLAQLPPADSTPADAINSAPPAMLLPPDAPTFDVVRVAPDAPPVLAGRAVPGSRLIVLDNGEVIGTATADGNGEWALVTDAPLAAGRHELTLALATPEGAVVVEQADTQAGPPQVEGDGLPTPPLKPEPGSAPTQIYMVQLASVPSASDAEREWTRLQRAHPTELGTAPVDIGAVEIGERGTFYRLRTGPFADRAAARQLCGALNAAGQECLVVRQATGE